MDKRNEHYKRMFTETFPVRFNLKYILPVGKQPVIAKTTKKKKKIVAPISYHDG